MEEKKQTKTMSSFIDVLGVTKDEYGQLFEKKGFKLSSGNLDKRVQFFMREFNLTKEQVKTLILKFNALLDIDVESDSPTGVKNKIKTLEELGFTKTEIIKHPLVLTIPCDKIKIRYALCLEMEQDKEFFMKNSNFMYSEDKIFARCSYLKAINKDVSKGAYTSENRFYDKYKVSTKDLMNKYVFNLTEQNRILENINIKQQISK